VTTIVHARGATLSEAFARAAVAVLARAVDTDSLDERDVREVRAHGGTADELLAHFIRECLYVHEVEGFAWRRIEFAVFDATTRAGAEPLRLHAFLHGDELDSGHRLPATGDVSHASVRPEQKDGAYEIRITFS